MDNIRIFYQKYFIFGVFSILFILIRRVFVIKDYVDNTHIFIQVQCFVAGWLSGVINLPLMADHCQTSLSVTLNI